MPASNSHTVWMKFSVIIPAYEAADFVGVAVRSALRQTVPPHEILVVDDGSTDDLGAALAPFAANIRLIRQANRGPSAARNAGIRDATGDWVVLLDADDYWYENRLARIARHIVTEPHHDLITTDAHVIDDGGQLLGCYYDTVAFSWSAQRSAILRSNFIFASTAIRRRTYMDLGGFDEGLRYCEDWDLWIRMIFSGACAGLIPEPLAVYRQRDTSLSRDVVSMRLGEAKVLMRAATRERLTPSERSIAFRRRSYSLYRALAVSLTSSGPSAPSRKRAWHLVGAPRVRAVHRSLALLALISPRSTRWLLSKVDNPGRRNRPPL